MAATLSADVLPRPRNQLKMRGESLRPSGETLRKIVADPVRAGRLVERALVHAGLTRKEAAAEMGYDDLGTSLSRWINGVEPAQFARLIAHDELRRGLALALAEDCGSDVDVETTVTFKRRAR